MMIARWAYNIAGPTLATRLGSNLIVEYSHGSFRYKMLYKKKKPVLRSRGVRCVERITDGNGNDVTEEIKSFMGPFRDFHGQHLTPGDLGYEQLHFHMIGDDNVPFHLRNPILFSINDRLDVESFGSDEVSKGFFKVRYDWRGRFRNEEDYEGYRVWSDAVEIVRYFFEATNEGFPQEQNITILAYPEVISRLKTTPWYIEEWQPDIVASC